jgi:hypothetical protein
MRDTNSNRIEVNVDQARQNGCVIEQGLASKACFPKAALARIFTVRASCDRFFEVLHEPTQRAEALAQLGKLCNARR